MLERRPTFWLHCDKRENFRQQSLSTKIRHLRACTGADSTPRLGLKPASIKAVRNAAIRAERDCVKLVIDQWRCAWRQRVLRAGRTWTGMNGRVAQNEPGMIEIRSLGHPFSGRAMATDSVSLIVPVDVFTDRGGLTTASNNVVLGGHRANLLIDHLSSVEANLDRFTHDDLLGVKDRLREMVFDTITPLVDRGGGNDQISQIGLMARARRFILANLASPNLTPDALGRELAVSRTRLYELFEMSGGVANYIRRRRLSAAHAMLADPSDTRKIAEVGIAIGFDSAANFSRAFTHVANACKFG